MISHAATAQHAAHLARLARDPSVRRLTRAEFIAREVAEGTLVRTTPTPDGLGVVRWDVRYLARPCPVDHPLNPGWVLVRDEPGALAHYAKLFPAPAEAEG